MDERSKLQLGLTIRQKLRPLNGTLLDRMSAMKGDHAAQGMLQSGATIWMAAQIVSDAINRLCSELVEDAARICRDADALDCVKEAVAQGFEIGEKAYWPVVKLATGKPERPLDAAVERVAADLILNIREDMEARLEIAGFDFEHASSQSASAEEGPVTTSQTLPKGGRPPAEFWDDLWVAMAVALYTGALVPKSQADIEHAMSNWISANDHSAATSTVRKRARKFWDGLRAAE